MKVYLLMDYYDNLQDLDCNICGDEVLGVYSNFDKAKQAAMEFKPRLLNVEDESERTVTELHPTVHMNNGAVRNVREYYDEDHQYEHELYIREEEVDAPRADE